MAAQTSGTSEALPLQTSGSDAPTTTTVVLGGNYIVYAHKFEGRLRASICLSTAALPTSKEPEKDSSIKPAQLSSNPYRSFWRVAFVTGVSVLLSLLVGFLVRRFWRRAA